MKNYSAIQLGEIMFEDGGMQVVYAEMQEMFKQMLIQKKLAQTIDKDLQQKCDNLQKICSTQAFKKQG